MPNHTDNRVILSHDDSDMIDDIYNVMNTEDTELCNHLIPEPRDDAGEPTSGWYDWRIENWGTKWDIYNTQCERTDANILVMSFNTAWSPPIPVYEKLVGLGFEVSARYLDEGWMYIGEFTGGSDTQPFAQDWCTDDVESVIANYPELDYEFGIGEMLEEMKEMECA